MADQGVSEVNDTEFVHFEVIAERPRRRRTRLPLALVLAGIVIGAIVAVMKWRASHRPTADVIPATELEARRAAAANADIPGC